VLAGVVGVGSRRRKVKLATGEGILAAGNTRSRSMAGAWTRVVSFAVEEDGEEVGRRRSGEELRRREELVGSLVIALTYFEELMGFVVGLSSSERGRRDPFLFLSFCCVVF